jgi:hypothetical protein
MKRIRFRHTTVRGEIEESDLIICTSEEWADRPESKEHSWSSGYVDLEEELGESILGEVPTLWFALKVGDD